MKFNYSNLRFGGYYGQTTSLRKLAIEKWGADRVATMGDSLIERKIYDEEHLVPMVVNSDGNNEETIYLIPEDYLDKCAKLER